MILQKHLQVNPFRLFFVDTTVILKPNSFQCG
uniref:Uncharacterized protein n=1 Tax=Anguilla anguilla TaxID=7936 RepID=A0A0E9PPN3_ANGAN